MMPQSTNETYNARTGVTDAVAVPWSVDAAKRYLKELRFERETAGIVVDGVPISTERGDHRNTMLSLALAGSQNPALQVPFKLADGSFTILTGAFAAAAWQHGQEYVAGCFAVEAQAAAAIESAEDSDEIDSILNGLVWPSQIFEV